MNPDVNYAAEGKASFEIFFFEKRELSRLIPGIIYAKYNVPEQY